MHFPPEKNKKKHNLGQSKVNIKFQVKKTFSKKTLSIPLLLISINHPLDLN